MSAGPRGPSRRNRLADRAPIVAGAGPLARVPAVVAFGAVAVVFAAGVLLGGLVGAVLLAVLALGVAVLLGVTWPRLSTAERAGRLLVLAVLVAVVVAVATSAGGAP